MAELLSGIAGIVISLALAYIPGLDVKFDALNGAQKRVVLAVSLAVAVLVIFGGSCLEYQTGVTCDLAGFKALLPALIMSFIANQSTYTAIESKPSKAVQAARLARDEVPQ